MFKTMKNYKNLDCEFLIHEEQELSNQKQKYDASRHKLNQLCTVIEHELIFNKNLPGICKKLKSCRSKFGETTKDIDNEFQDEIKAEEKKFQLQCANYDKEIVELTESCTKLHEEVEKLSIESEIVKQKYIQRYENLRTLLKIFKSNLEMNLTVQNIDEESDLLHISFYDIQDQKESYIKVMRNCEEDYWILKEVEPKIANFDKVAARLLLSQDIIGCIALFGRIFSKKVS